MKNEFKSLIKVFVLVVTGITRLAWAVDPPTAICLSLSDPIKRTGVLPDIPRIEDVTMQKTIDWYFTDNREKIEKFTIDLFGPKADILGSWSIEYTEI